MNIRTIFVFEFEDTLFHHDSAVLLPSQPEGPSSENGVTPSSQTQVTGLSLVADIFKYVEQNPEKELIIVGNTDTSGKPDYNFKLSMIRASSVLYLLECEKKKWVENSLKKYKIEDIQQILKHYSRKKPWNCDPGIINDKLNNNTRNALKEFQVKNNINDDGKIGEETFGAVYECYISDIADMLMTDTSGLTNYKNNIKYISGQFQILACGESRPIEAAHKKNYRSQTNRRVEVLFLDSGEILEIGCPNPMGPYQKKTCDRGDCPFILKKGFKFDFLEPTEYPVERLPPKIFLEVEIFDLNKNEEEVIAFVGKKVSIKDYEDGKKNIFEDFTVEKLIEKEKWKSIKGHIPEEKAFQIELKRDWLEKPIKMQAKRKYIAYEYDDGERTLIAVPSKNASNFLLAEEARIPGDKDLVETGTHKEGDWPNDVKIKNLSDSFWPTEESIANIISYSESEESKYNNTKIEKVIPLLNKIMILQKEGEIEYVVDRFISI